MKSESDPLAADRLFFTSLLESDFEALDQMLSDDFVLVDVLSGSEVTKVSLLSAIKSRELKFIAIEPIASRSRLYQTTAVINGQTHIKGQFAGKPFTVSSRYTHVYVEQQSQWRMVAAQGTQITS